MNLICFTATHSIVLRKKKPSLYTPYLLEAKNFIYFDNFPDYVLCSMLYVFLCTSSISPKLFPDGKVFRLFLLFSVFLLAFQTCCYCCYLVFVKKRPKITHPHVVLEVGSQTDFFCVEKIN